MDIQKEVKLKKTPVIRVVNSKMVYTAILLNGKTYWKKREMKMNKGDLINEVVKVVSSKKEAQAAVDCILSNITEALRNKEKVQISGFGSFKVSKREARKGRHPLTGEEIHIEARIVPKFVPGKALKDAVK